MKKVSSMLILVLFLAFSVNAFAQEEKKEKTEEIKTGWNVGALPVVSFDSDMGFQYGALSSIYNYGDGSRYPEFDHMFYVEASKFTKGGSIFRFAYEGDQLIEGVRLNFDLGYLPDDVSAFYGFNGYESVYNAGWEDQDSPDYQSRMMYKHKRNLFRTTADFVGDMGMGKLQWSAGIGYYDFTIGSVDIAKYNEGVDPNDPDYLPSLDETPGLYENYVDWGLIPAAEAEGGTLVSLKAGLTYDSRDNRANPNQGIWTEAGFFYSPSFLSSSENDFLKFYITHRQYFTAVKNRLTFAYRVGYQTTISGETPWYAQNLMVITANRSAFSEGLGGSKSIRGVLRNRVVGDGIAYGNFEARLKAVKFKFINQNFYIGINGFLDLGKAISLIETTVPTEINTTDYFDKGAEAV
ncbi:MAG: BamA/TamA family outer membrane protein, partial [Bacteroidales bacterium]|nr:BamA/TamA family outer membrane protein [Bacteroidales bacterium]